MHQVVPGMHACWDANFKSRILFWNVQMCNLSKHIGLDSVVQLGSFVMETMWICDVYSGFVCLVGCSGKFDNWESGDGMMAVCVCRERAVTTVVVVVYGVVALPCVLLIKLQEAHRRGGGGAWKRWCCNGTHYKIPMQNLKACWFEHFGCQIQQYHQTFSLEKQQTSADQGRGPERIWHW